MLDRIDTDVLDYFPIREGLKGASIGLKKLGVDLGDSRQRHFQFDEFFDFYRENKIACRKERLGKYYQYTEAAPACVVRHVIERLLLEYPEIFQRRFFNEKDFFLICALTKEELFFEGEGFVFVEAESFYNREKIGVLYQDAWDALAMQVAEDLVIHKVPKAAADFTMTIHLCHANGWSAEGAVGQTFDRIHREVRNIRSIIPDSRKILDAIIKSAQSLERVGALQYRTSGELNRHPSIDRRELNVDFDSKKHPHVYLRFERQTVTSFPEEACFLFTIRTYLTHLDQRGVKDWKWEAFKKTLLEQRNDVKCSDFIEAYKEDLKSWVASESLGRE